VIKHLPLQLMNDDEGKKERGDSMILDKKQMATK
jgi:hypothetical protein